MLACGALICAVSIGAATAYLTATASATNPFSLDTDLKIELTEPSFSPEAAKGMKPMQTTAKDPTVTNKGSVDAYVAVDVSVPVFSGDALVDGMVAPQTDTDLFTYAVDPAWKQVGEAKLADGQRTYRYLYDAKLASGASTPRVFDAVTLANLTEDVGISEAAINVVAHAIQSEGFASAAEACSAYDTQAHASVSMDD